MGKRIKFRLRPRSEPTERGDIGRIQSAKEIVGLVKDVQEILWKTAPLALLPAGFMVWSYLRAIHWIDLFSEAALSGMGLVFLVVSAILMALFVIFVFLIPSLFMVGVVHIFDSDARMSKESVSLYQVALLVWGVALLVSLVLEFPPWTYLASPMIVAFAFGLWRQRLKLFGQSVAFQWKQVGGILLEAFGAALSMGGTIFPLLFTLNFASGVPEYARDYPYVALVVCFLISVIGLVPGFMYLRSRTRHEEIAKSIKVSAYGTAFMSYLVMTLVFAFMPVSSMIFEATGVYSNEESHFQILKEDLGAVLREAGLSVTQKEKYSFVRGYVRFSFGGVKLLCKTQFEPKFVTPEARRAAIRDKKPDPAVLAGAHCVPTQSGEVRKFRH